MQYETLSVLLAGLGGACCPPENVSVVASRVDGECVLDIDYEGTALGVYVTEVTVSSAASDALGEEVSYPRQNERFEGIVFFGLDTTTFPDGIVPPVRYGNLEKDTENGYMRSDDEALNVDADGQPVYARVYPMPTINLEPDCVRCQLSAVDDQGRAVPQRAIGSFKVGVVTLGGNAETPPITDFRCPLPGGAPIQYGTDLPRHYGAD